MHDRLKPLAGVTLFLLLLACLSGVGPGSTGAPGMSSMTYSMIRTGMSESEVQRITGFVGERGPEFREKGSSAYDVKYALRFQPGYSAMIEFRGGIVSAKRITEEGWHEQENRLTRSAFESIREGMTMEEVVRLTGFQGESVTDAWFANVHYFKVRYIFADSDGRYALIDYRDGRVRGKSMTNLSGESSAAADKDAAALPQVSPHPREAGSPF